jgi:protein-S-isoprenylcysteine O-methyltransferase Ste14
VIGEFLTFVAIVIGIATIRVRIKTEEVILSEKKFGEESLAVKREVKATLILWMCDKRSG